MIKFPVAALTISVCFVVLLFSEAEASELKPCPSGKYFTWHMCFGTHTFVNGDKYVGEWKHGKMDGDGRYTDVDGNIKEGIWNYNKFKGNDPKVDERRKADIESAELEFKNLKLRAKQGNVDAQFKLGVMYEDGKGVPQSDRSAKYWYKLAAKQGRAGAKEAVNRIAREKREQKRVASKSTSSVVINFCKRDDSTIYRFTTKNFTGWCGKDKEITKAEYDRLKREQELIAREKREQERIAEEKRKQERQCKGDDESKWQNCEGTLTSHSGKVYVGIFKDGIFDGEDAEHGIKWVGGYKNGTLNGQGTLTFFPPSKAVGNKYVGEVNLGGKFHGQGTYTFANGNKYVGEYRNGKYNGQGTFTTANGNKYVGEWRDSERHGQGTYTYTEESFFFKNEGIWKNDEFQYERKDPKVEEELKAKKRELERLEEANDNIRLALDILNYTVSGSKESREEVTVVNAENCIFQVETILGKEKLYVNNIILDTVKLYSMKVNNPLFNQLQDVYYVGFDGDKRVLGDRTSGRMALAQNADLDRVRKAWGLLFSKACKGASPSEF